MSDESGRRLEPGLDAIAKALYAVSRSGGTVAILPHVRADGDAVGTSLAVASAVARLGGRPDVRVEEPLDWTLSRLPGAGLIGIGNPEGPERGAEPDAAVMLDCGDVSRLAGRAALYEAARVKIVLDHHISSHPSEGLRLIDPASAAVGEIAYHLIRRMETLSGSELLSHDEANCLMGAILTDTGGFRFSNTTRETFRIASALMQYDVDISALSFDLLESMTLAKYRLIGLANEHAAFHRDGTVAILCVSRQMLLDTGADENDTNGLANMLRAVDSVRVALVLKEGENGIVRVNIRCKEGFDAAGFASAFGGGGHARAAGFNLEGTDLESAAAMLAILAGKRLDGGT